MKHLEIVGALLVLLAVALAIVFGRPAPPDESLFGAELALEPVLGPLTLPGGTLELRGTVASAAGTPVEDAFVVLLRPEDAPAESEPLYHAYTDADGRFALTRLVPGPYRVVLTHPSAPPRVFPLELPQAGEVQWTLAEPLPPLPTLPTLRRTALRGNVRASGLFAPLSDGLAGFEVVLVPDETTPVLSGACERRASTDAGGTFVFEELVVASYRVELLPPWARGGTWPVVARARCALGAGEPPPLELVPAVGALEGALEEEVGRPLVGALVTVAALDARDPVGEPELWPPVVTDAVGHFAVELLPPGRYRVRVRAGAALRELEVTIESGKRANAPFGLLDPRAPAPASGG
jgi:hypothetical protein